MAMSDALAKWFDDPSKVEELEKRTSEVENKIKEDGIVTRSQEVEEISEEDLQEETENSEEVEQEEVDLEELEDSEEVVYLDQEAVEAISNAVSDLLEVRMAASLEAINSKLKTITSIEERLSKVEERKMESEDTPKSQKLRFKLDEAIERKKELSQESQEKTPLNLRTKTDVREIRKSRLALLKENKSNS